MADQQAANQKQRECVEHVPVESAIESLTITDSESTSNQRTQNKTITTIYYDCLERIFDFLDLESLLNLAGTCKRLKIATAAKFKDDHGEKEINLKPGLFMKPGLFVQRKKIEVIGLKYCYPFLRCFGAKISHLQLVEFNTFRSSDKLEQYINKYCADTLTSYEFHYRHYNDMFSMENNPKPFKHVEKVLMEVCDLHGPFAHVNDMFPNLRYLVFSAVNIDEGFEAAVLIPHLERLDIGLISAFNFGLEHAADMIKANRQLHQLHICTYQLEEIKLSTLLDMIDDNASISELDIYQELTSVNTDELLRIPVEHPLMVDLDFRCYRMTADNVIVLIRKLGLLKKIHFNLVDGTQYDRLRNQLDKEWQLEHVNDEDASENDEFTYVLTR